MIGIKERDSRIQKLEEENKKLKAKMDEAIELIKRSFSGHIPGPTSVHISCIECEMENFIARHEKGERP